MDSVIEAPEPVPQKPTHAGMICFNRAGEVLMISTLGSGSFWLFPKGHIEPEETGYETAEREILEEAGIKAIVDTAEPVGYSVFTQSAEEIVVEWWCGLAINAEELSHYDEAFWRKRLWVSWESALELLSFSDQRNILRKALCLGEEEV